MHQYLQVHNILKKKFPHSVLLINTSFFISLCENNLLEVSLPKNSTDIIFVYVNKKNYKKILINYFFFLIKNPYLLLINLKKIVFTFSRNLGLKLFEGEHSFYLFYFVINSKKLTRNERHQIFSKDIVNYAEQNKLKLMVGQYFKNNKLAERFYEKQGFELIKDHKHTVKIRKKVL